MALLKMKCIDCTDVQNSVQRSCLRQRRWAEADAEFLEWIKTKAAQSSSSEIVDRPEIYGGFASRQKYLRSYTFEKRKSWKAEKARRRALLSEKPKRPASASSDVSSIRGRRSCSVLETVLGFFFLCAVKPEVRG
ncbi:hypothetical protein SAY87_001569 [Trapa incisa]|uniref:Uncharacterized protein n=1 Tax=Trapa incisa TaxID=236973 RepID=A0AAN7GNQ1_9MYRT|nr:hypothetical protein SAY87_001569 [Trapa incisa]